MNERLANQAPQAPADRGGPTGIVRDRRQPELSTDQMRILELEAANVRLLQLVGELLVSNQQLRERNASTLSAAE